MSMKLAFYPCTFLTTSIQTILLSASLESPPWSWLTLGPIYTPNYSIKETFNSLNLNLLDFISLSPSLPPSHVFQQNDTFFPRSHSAPKWPHFPIHVSLNAQSLLYIFSFSPLIWKSLTQDLFHNLSFLPLYLASKH